MFNSEYIISDDLFLISSTFFMLLDINCSIFVWLKSKIVNISLLKFYHKFKNV